MRMTGPDSGRLLAGQSAIAIGGGATQMTSWLPTHRDRDRTGTLQCRHSSSEFLGKERLAISRFWLVGASTRVVPMWGSLSVAVFFASFHTKNRY